MKNFFKKYNNKVNVKNEENIISTDYIRELYSNPDALTEIELINKSKKLKFIWCEPSCLGIDLDKNYDYKIVTHDKSFRIEFTDNDNVVFWVNKSFGFKLYKRKQEENNWLLDIDMSTIN